MLKRSSSRKKTSKHEQKSLFESPLNQIFTTKELLNSESIFSSPLNNENYKILNSKSKA